MQARLECNGDNSGSQVKEQIIVQKLIDIRNDNNGHASEFFTPMSSMPPTEFPQKSTPSSQSCSIISTPSSSSGDTPTILKLTGTPSSNSLQSPSLPSLSLSALQSAPSTTGTTPSSNSASPTPSSTSNGTTSSTSNLQQQANGDGGGKGGGDNSGMQSEDYLLQWKDMPNHLQFNPYVLTGYRPLQSFKGCVFSLFYWHNETINILTHGIPIVYILYTVPSLIPWEKDFRFLSFCHLFGAVAPWCGSFVYHLFMNLEKGEDVYYRLLKLDMLGIWVSQSFGALPMITATCFCLSTKWKWTIILAYCVLSIWGLYKAMTALSPWERRLCFLLPFTMRAVLTLSRTFRRIGGSPEALTHVYLQDMVSVAGGAIGAMHIPEKWFPGKVDLYFNSHNIMHILVVIAVYSMHQATISDFEWMSKTECHLSNASRTIDMTIDAHTEL